MKQTTRMVILAAIAILLLLAVAWVYFGGGDQAEVQARSGPTENVMMTGLLVSADGRVTVPRKQGRQDPDDPHVFHVDGHDQPFYEQALCQKTNRTWPFGKDGLTTSPFVRSAARR